MLNECEFRCELYLHDNELRCSLYSNEVVNHLATLDEMAQHMNIMVPMQVLADIDNSRNPMNVTRDRIERAATENQFMNGKIAAIEVSFD